MLITVLFGNYNVYDMYTNYLNVFAQITTIHIYKYYPAAENVKKTLCTKR